MKPSKFLILSIGLVFCLTSAGKPIAAANEIDGLNRNLNRQVARLANTLRVDDDTEEPSEILRRAILGYEDEFDDYIDITALNVTQKDLVNLPNFDSNYVAPTFGEVMNRYQTNLEISLSPSQLEKYELIRETNFSFDRYAALNEVSYTDLATPPKYMHSNLESAQTPTALLAILAAAGLADAAVIAFSGAVGSLTVAVSTSWIPFAGWALAVALAVGALIALTVVMIQYWNEIRSAMDDIKAWFLEQFSAFAELIESFFGDVVAKGEESTIAERQVIGGTEIVWKDAHMTRDTAINIATELRRNGSDVLLMKNWSSPRPNEMSWWLATAYVTVDFVVNHRLCEAPYYFSTYTWYNSTAKAMLFDSTPSYSNYGGYGYKNLVYHKFTNMTRAVYGWNHYHVGQYNPVTETSHTYAHTIPISDVHCFFGLTYVRLPNDQGFANYPANP